MDDVRQGAVTFETPSIDRIFAGIRRKTLGIRRQMAYNTQARVRPSTVFLWFLFRVPLPLEPV
jgi:hypothetical protein